MLLSPRRNGLTSSFKEVRAFKVLVGACVDFAVHVFEGFRVLCSWDAPVAESDALPSQIQPLTP